MNKEIDILDQELYNLFYNKVKHKIEIAKTLEDLKEITNLLRAMPKCQSKDLIFRIILMKEEII